MLALNIYNHIYVQLRGIINNKINTTLYVYLIQSQNELNIWIWPCTQDSWSTVKSKKVWGVRTEGKGKNVLKGDKIIFYVNGTLHFHGIYEVKSDWHESVHQWPTQYRDVVAEIDLIEVQLGFANVNKLAQSLKFIVKKKSVGVYLRGTTLGPANSGKPISEEDYALILNEIKNVQQEPNFEQIKEHASEFRDLVDLSDYSYSTAKIDTENKTLAEIFHDVEKGDCAVPDFQRYWTWNRKQIEELWESIFQGYYVGSLLTWRSHTPTLSKMPIVGGPTLEKNSDLILDGQQRITAIYYVIKSPNKPLPNTDVPYEFFLNINALLDQSRDSSEIIDSYKIKEVETKNLRNFETQYKKKIFPLKQLHNNFAQWLFGFYNYLKNNEGYDDEDAQKYHIKLDEILTNVWSRYHIPVVKLPETLHLDNVATVFERINSKGTPLGTFDLLNARFITHSIVLKDLWECTKTTHPNMQKWYDDSNNKIPLYILQVMTLWKSEYVRRKYVLTLDEMYKVPNTFNTEAFYMDWKKASDYVEKAITRITSREPLGFGAINYNYIPHETMIPIIAALLQKINGRSDKGSCLEKMHLWYWINVTNDRYSGAVDSIIEHDYKNMMKWFDGNERPFDIEEQNDFNTHKKNSALYKSVMCMIAKKGALDFVEGDSFGMPEIHHIFPHSKAEKFNAGKDINSVLNGTLIFNKTNKHLGNKNPSEYLHTIMKEQNIEKTELQKRLATHLISSSAFECMLNDDFAGFIRERQKTIGQEFKRLICPDNDVELNIRNLLKREDQHVEFKETLRYDVRTGQKNTALEETVMKELACFMNSDGGHILIGVNDAGIPVGLERDYQTFTKKNSGYFQEHLTNLINKYFEKPVNTLIEWKFHQIDGYEICIGTIKPSSRPIYISTKDGKKLYVRHNNTCQPYDIEAAVGYISKHWGMS